MFAEDARLDYAGYRIRRASLSDLNEVCAIEEDSFDDSYPQYLIAELLRENRSSFFVAVNSDGRVVGYCVSTLKDEVAHLISIAVSGTYRRSGIAKAMLWELKAFLSSRGVKVLVLEVKVDNEPAVQLYSSLGFAKVGLIENYYSNGASALKMQMAVADIGCEGG